MIRLTIWDPSLPSNPGDLSIDPKEVVAVFEHEDYGVQIVRIVTRCNARFTVWDSSRTVAERIATAKSSGITDLERYQP